jgi:hypothetical protein
VANEDADAPTKHAEAANEDADAQTKHADVANKHAEAANEYADAPNKHADVAFESSIMAEKDAFGAGLFAVAPFVFVVGAWQNGAMADRIPAGTARFRRRFYFERLVPAIHPLNKIHLAGRAKIC